MEEIKTELRNEIQETKSELQNKLNQIMDKIPTGINDRLQTLQESVNNLSLKEDKLEMILEKLVIKMDYNSTHLPENTTTEPSLTQISDHGQLTTKYLDTKLPSPNKCLQTIYDGIDGIYLFGSCSREASPNIFKFSISSESLTSVGNLPGEAKLGSVQSDGFGNIFYFGGGSGGDQVYYFDPENNVSSTVATLPYDVQYGVSVKYNDTVFILGGYAQGRELLAFNMTTRNYSVISTNLPFRVSGGAGFTVGRKAYIFDATELRQGRNALELDLDTYVMTQVGPETLPRFAGRPSAVWDGNFGYIIGGYLETENVTSGMFQFDPRTLSNTFIPVYNWPVEGLNDLQVGPASVFVPGRKRIYCFGGYSFNATSDVYHDDIFYIDLTPVGITSNSTT